PPLPPPPANPPVPRALHPYIRPLRAAPVSHITSFLLLHEITAIAPLIALATVFHYTTWLPATVTESAWMRDGVAKFGRYFARKGCVEAVTGPAQRDWAVNGGGGGVGMRVVLEVAAAWAVTKALLPVRLAVCVWATPWFARVGVVPVLRVFR
ncbi:hypothetical protein K490DRAFT_7407, partial [Saccharata proteae CBS 121410]